MALERKDRVKDQTTTTGTGTVTIDGVAATGYRTITAAHTTGATVRYTIANSALTEWEVGEGVWTSAGATLTRVTVYASSNAGALVTFSAGTKVVFTTPTAADTDEAERLIRQNSRSAAYELVLADAGKHILHPAADTTARTFTIPANSSVAFPVGTVVTFINQNAGGVVTIAITTDTMRLAGAGTTGSRTLAANGIATAVKLTSTEWIINGTGLT